MELIYETLYKLRIVYRFRGYVHVKGIPGADARLIQQTGYFADRMSVNLELPTAEGLHRLAPNKHRKNTSYADAADTKRDYTGENRSLHYTAMRRLCARRSVYTDDNWCNTRE